MLRITNQLVIQEATNRGWSYSLIDEDSGLVEYILPTGATVLVKSVVTQFSPALGSQIADRKQLFYDLATKWSVPIPETLRLKDDASAAAFLEKYRQIVVKPQDGAHGNGVTTNVTDPDSLAKAIARAREFSDGVVLQQQVYGDDYRLLMINHKLAAAAIRKPASVTGDGVQTVRQLIETENQNPTRGENYQTPLNKISLPAAELFLGEALGEVPGAGIEVQVAGTANIGTGGYAIDVTDSISEQMVAVAEDITKKLGMPICGVDFIVDENLGPRVIEINASPSFGLHAFPYRGQPRPVAKIFLDWLEPKI